MDMDMDLDMAHLPFFHGGEWFHQVHSSRQGYPHLHRPICHQPPTFTLGRRPTPGRVQSHPYHLRLFPVSPNGFPTSISTQNEAKMESITHSLKHVTASDLQQWLGVTVGTAVNMKDYADDDLEAVKAGNLVIV
ncbi:hypothetical protein BDN67DRAFT_779315 [Paxillus ammoniavirescens]|nr:hypothetical protein BDN67DRAFT_779315 [Paxillus ammoniavirescens]